MFYDTMAANEIDVASGSFYLKLHPNLTPPTYCLISSAAFMMFYCPAKCRSICETFLNFGWIYFFLIDGF